MRNIEFINSVDKYINLLDINKTKIKMNFISSKRKTNQTQPNQFPYKFVHFPWKVVFGISFALLSFNSIISYFVRVFFFVSTIYIDSSITSPVLVSVNIAHSLCFLYIKNKLNLTSGFSSIKKSRNQ